MTDTSAPKPTFSKKGFTADFWKRKDVISWVRMMANDKLSAFKEDLESAIFNDPEDGKEYKISVEINVKFTEEKE